MSTVTYDCELSGDHKSIVVVELFILPLQSIFVRCSIHLQATSLRIRRELINKTIRDFSYDFRNLRWDPGA